MIRPTWGGSKEEQQVGAVKSYSWSPSHDQCGMLSLFGTMVR